MLTHTNPQISSSTPNTIHTQHSSTHTHFATHTHPLRSTHRSTHTPHDTYTQPHTGTLTHTQRSGENLPLAGSWWLKEKKEIPERERNREGSRSGKRLFFFWRFIIVARVTAVVSRDDSRYTQVSTVSAETAEMMPDLGFFLNRLYIAS